MGETMRAIAEFISTVGFPIFVVVGFGFYFFKYREESNQAINELKIIVENNNKLISQNTQILIELIKTLKKGE